MNGQTKKLPEIIAAVAPNRRCRLFGKQLSEPDWVYAKGYEPKGFHGLIVDKIEQHGDFYWLFHKNGVVSIGVMCGWVLHVHEKEQTPEVTQEPDVVGEEEEVINNFLGIGKIVKKKQDAKTSNKSTTRKTRAKSTTKRVSK
jgi:hypothetical protein